MKEVPEQLRKLRRQYLRYQQAEIIYSIFHKKLFELASDAGAIYRIDGTVFLMPTWNDSMNQRQKRVRRSLLRMALWQRNSTMQK